MVELFSGTPGSGKSLHVARKIYDHLRFVGPVVCNFDISVKGAKHELYCIDNTQLTVDYLIGVSKDYLSKHRYDEDKILLVIDEAQILFNAREWGRLGREKWLSFFSQHRKLAYRVILVAQYDRMLDRQIRSLIEIEHIHRKCSNMGIKGMIFSLLAGGKLHVCVSIWYPLKERLEANFFVARKKYYSMYDTTKLFGGDKVG